MFVIELCINRRRKKNSYETPIHNDFFDRTACKKALSRKSYTKKIILENCMLEKKTLKKHLHKNHFYRLA